MFNFSRERNIFNNGEVLVKYRKSDGRTTLSYKDNGKEDWVIIYLPAGLGIADAQEELENSQEFQRFVDI